VISPVYSRAVASEDPAEVAPDVPSAGASLGWPLAADEVADDVGVASDGSPPAVGVGSPLAAELVAEALVDAESLALELAVADGVLEAASPDEVADAVLEAASPDEVADGVLEAASPDEVADAVLEAASPDEVADAVLEAASPDEDAEAEGSAMGAGVGIEPDARTVVVCEVEVMVLTVTPEPLEKAEGDLAALKAATSAGVSRTVIFSVTLVVSLMLVAGSRFTYKSW